MPKFFMPYLDDPKTAEEAYQGYKKPVLDGWNNVQITERRIFAIEYRHDGKMWAAKVGERDPENPGLVVAIYETTGGAFVMVTLYPTPDNKGLEYRAPHLIGTQDALHVADFEKA